VAGTTKGVLGWSKKVNVARQAVRCQRCAGTQPTTFTYCPRCRRVLCSRCSQAPEGNLCELYNCHRCLARDIPGGLALARLRAPELAALATRSSTKKLHQSEVEGYLKWGKGHRACALPATSQEVGEYMAFCVRDRCPVLDGSTVETALAGVSAWHEQARVAVGGGIANPCRSVMVRRLRGVMKREFKKPSRAKRGWAVQEWKKIILGFSKGRTGQHNALVVMLCALGPFRPVAATNITVKYEIRRNGAGKPCVRYLGGSGIWVERSDPRWPRPYIVVHLKRDKNVNASKVRFVPIPDVCMGVRPVRMLEDYLVGVGPPSGGKLLVAPHGASGFRNTRYTACCALFKRMHNTAFPNLGDDRVGGGTPRKSMPVWMWRAGHSRRKIADVCGWSIRDKRACDSYIWTDVDQQLKVKRGLWKKLGGGKPAH